MTGLVLDASVALSWCFDNEGTDAADRILDSLFGETATVPGIWPLEIANSLIVSERRGRLTVTRSAQFLKLLEGLSIIVDTETPQNAFTRTMELARDQMLTGYDAAYLELAIRLDLPLASKDTALCNAAERVGVTVLRAA